MYAKTRNFSLGILIIFSILSSLLRELEIAGKLCSFLLMRRRNLKYAKFILLILFIVSLFVIIRIYTIEFDGMYIYQALLRIWVFSQILIHVLLAIVCILYAVKFSHEFAIFGSRIFFFVNFENRNCEQYDSTVSAEHHPSQNAPKPPRINHA